MCERQQSPELIPLGSALRAEVGQSTGLTARAGCPSGQPRAALSPECCRCRSPGPWSARYYFSKTAALATHCHLPSGILTQVSTNRSRVSTAFPSWVVPFAVVTPTTVAVLP